MNADPIAGPNMERLRTHLPPEAFARLERGTLRHGALTAEVGRMRAAFEAIASFVPRRIALEQIARPEPGRICGAFWHGSVLVADLSGFTALSGRLSSLGKQGAEEISAVINRLFGALVEEIYRFRGMLLKFGGDALTVFFDDAVLGPQHAACACGAALALQQRMAAFRSVETRAGAFPLQLRTGVHSGRVFAAQVGDLEHIELVVTGRALNRAAQAQALAAPGETIVTDEALAGLAGAAAEPRDAGFARLRTAPAVDVQPWQSSTIWQPGTGDVHELLALAERIDALRPYLPRGLPRRFLAANEAADPGEFRPVSMLFAEFRPFSDALEQLGDDGERAAHVLNAYFRRAQAVVHRFGGIVNKAEVSPDGDRLMALFGAPAANEDDPERAVRAALALRDALAEANAEIGAAFRLRSLALNAPRGTSPGGEPFALRQRIGINTGVVFAGRVGAARRHEYTVMGQPVNLAARLAAAAADGAILLSPTTRRAVDRFVALRELPALALKGLDAPLRPAEVLDLLEVAQDAGRGLARPSLINREEELARLVAEGRAALAGSGRVVAITGEAGAGKSRLVEEALLKLVPPATGATGAPEFFPCGVECQSYDQRTPYAAARGLLRQVLGAALFDDPASAPAAVAARVAARAPDLARFTPLLGDLLGLPLAETPLTAALAAEQRHARAHELAEALVLAEARRAPRALIVDDLHWCDASSLDLIARLAARAAEAPLLLVLCYRRDPPIPEPWRELPHCAWIALRELSPEANAALVRSLLEGEPPPALATLIERAQGNPFFVEAIIHELIDTGVLRRGAHGWMLTGPLEAGALPDSVEGVITARLDRLDEDDREVLRVASVVGRRFSYPVVSGVLAHNGRTHEQLRRLTHRDLIAPEAGDGASDDGPPSSYQFRHVMIRDVVYGSILYARRRELHRRVARQIEQLRADRLDDELGLLANHYLLAEEWERAFEYHLRAARLAQRSYANREAIALLEQALAIAGPARAATAHLVEAHERLGYAHTLLGEYDPAREHYSAALALVHQAEDATRDDVLRLHHHIARVYEKRADFDAAFAWVERALALAGDAPSQEAARCRLLGAGLHQRQGRYRQALDWGEQALRMAEALGNLREQANAYILLGGVYRNLGESNRALDITHQSLRLYKQLDDPCRIADAHNNLANICLELGHLADARMHYEAAADLKAAIGDVYGQAMVANNLGDLYKLQGQIEDAIAQFTESLIRFERLGSEYAVGVLQMNIGAARLLRGDIEAAEEHFRQSEALFTESGAGDFLPELRRSQAELHLRKGDLGRARTACEQSLADAARLNARAEEGATRRVLGVILARSGQPDQAWNELNASLAILREAAVPYEIARTLLAMAELAPLLRQRADGQAALNEALRMFHHLGAQRDVAEALAVAMRNRYRVSASPASAA